MKTLKIIWQKDPEEDPFEERLNLTYLNLKKVISSLSPVLSTFGINLVFEKETGSKKIKRKTNWEKRIFIEGELIEEIIGLNFDKGYCFGVCGKTCETFCMENLEEIPEHLINMAIFQKAKDTLMK